MTPDQLNIGGWIMTFVFFILPILVTIGIAIKSGYDLLSEDAV